MSRFTRAFGAAPRRPAVRPSIPQLSIQIEEITPEQAARDLARSRRKNRENSPAKRRTFAATMREGKWNPFNSTAVSYDTGNDIINGHTRLEACVEAGVPFRSIVVRGVPPETFETEDTGRMRTSIDVLHIAGKRNAVTLAPAARSLVLWERGHWAKCTMRGSRDPAQIIHPHDMIAEAERRPQLQRAAAYLMTNLHKVRANRFHLGLLGALHCLTQGHRRHDTFWPELVEGVGVGPTSPVRMFRDRIADSVHGTGRRVNSVNQTALLTKAWNFYARGEEPTRLIYTPGKEEFPQPLTRLQPQLVQPAETKEAA